MKLIVDVNLPKYFKFFNTPDFLFVSDIDPRMSDNSLWNYALKNDLVIVTKDTDFYSRSLISDNKPRIVFINIGNTTLSELHIYFEKNWPMIQKAIETNYLVIATKESIDVVL